MPINNMICGLIKRTIKDYVFLRRLSPEHELLKYFSINEQGFSINPRDEIIEEFLETFRGDVPPAELARIMRIPFVMYEDMLTSTAFRNYIDSLEGAIRFAEMMN